MRRIFLLMATPLLLLLAAPTSSQADAIGAGFGAGTGLVAAGPVGAVVGGVVGAIWGRPFWGPPNSPRACWIDNSFTGIACITPVGGIIIELSATRHRGFGANIGTEGTLLDPITLATSAAELAPASARQSSERRAHFLTKARHR